MITKTELNEYRIITGLHLGQLERDYLQNIVLMVLFRLTDNHLVFKGGTALQKVYNLDRFSEDLDFTLCEEFKIDDVMKKLCDNLKLFGYSSDFDKKKEFVTGVTFRLKIKGPLFNGSVNSIFYLKMEISFREKVILKALVKEIKPVYNDLSPFIVKVMDIEEILAEKIRAIFTRDAARDIFDLYFIIKKGVSPNIILINKKLEYYELTFNLKNFNKKVAEKEKLWEKELSFLVKNLPKFKKVKKEIKEFFKVLG
ncbi:hypothetical protein COV11_04815 [Candidatus Woesearchaeota archaeon CG10_big_fil_rev_8_21_14_0_10_30_7]|nr:MAG: hypothetical protein COV11_04815 [Candidatus Woesearchaeota archaeon CG10_big_fil_rev_8_21_14_0_10_30_7]